MPPKGTINPDQPKKKSRRGRKAKIDTLTESSESQSPAKGGEPGGRYRPLNPEDLNRIHETVLTIMDKTGFSEATPSMIEHVTSSGGIYTNKGRLTFPPELVNTAIKGLDRGFTLCGQIPSQDMHLDGTNVHLGSGGASPTIIDLYTGEYRDSNLLDIYNAARIVDQQQHIHFFSRPMVARDMPDEKTLDINTAYACLAGTSKHVCVSATYGEHVKDIAKMSFLVAGSKENFQAKPFLSFNVNHVAPPMRFSMHGCDVIEQCAIHGMPAHTNVFSQVGASSPVGLAGAVAQSVAESLAGGVFAWLVNPEAKVLFGPKPMITDLRTGGISGGGGEQAMVMAAATQMMQFYNLVNVSIAGATDSKIPDAQSGFEKCLAVSLAAHAGSNLITQAAGTHASLMATALESYVIDNDMLGGIMSSLRDVEFTEETLSAQAIDQVARGEGHFLGEADTYARMKTDFVYPEISDRRNYQEWIKDGSKDIREIARQKAKQILAQHYPNHISQQVDNAIRDQFDIRLPQEKMKPV